MSEVYVGRKFRTRFVKGDKSAGGLRDVLDAGIVLNEAGMTPENAGNLSVRTESGMLITVGGKNKGELAERDVVEVVGFDGDVADVRGSREPSSETPMHWEIYERYPGVNAVIHVHDELIVGNIDKVGYPVTEETEYGTSEQAEMVGEMIGLKNYVVIRGHGIVSAGKTLGECLELVFKVHDRVEGLVAE